MDNYALQGGETLIILSFRAYNIATSDEYTGSALGATAKYWRDGATVKTALVLAATTMGVYASADATHAGIINTGEGIIQLSAPTAALAAAVGVRWCHFTLTGIAGVNIIPVRVDLLGGNPYSTTPPDVSVAKINNVSVLGAGTALNKWRG